MDKNIQYRAAVIESPAIDLEARTALVKFSSETPVKRSFGNEVISHNEGDVDMSFLNSGNAPLLLEHDRGVQIGIVESASIDSGEGRAKVRFGRSSEGEKVWQDVVDGIRKNVSVGYVVTDKSVDRSGEEAVVRTSWKPVEISIVSIPADENTGIGRSAAEIETAENKQEQEELRQMDNTQNTQTEVETRALDIEALTQEVRSAEIKRAAEINDLAVRHGVQSVGQDFIRNGKSVDEFRAAVLDSLAARPTVNTASTIGLTEKETRSYSLARAINAIVTGDFSEAGLELEVSKAVAKAQGKTHSRSSIFVPGEYLERAAGPNAFTVASNPSVVNHTKVGFLDVLWNNTIASKLGVDFMSGLNGVIELPKFTSAVTARFADEGQDGTIDAITSGQVEMAPRSLIALAELTRSMLVNSTAMEAKIQAQLQKAIAVKIDATVFETILANTNINWETVPVGGIDFKALRELVKNLEVANALTDSCKFAFNPLVGNLLSTTEKDSNTVGNYLRDDNGNVAGYGSASSNHVGSNIIFGDYSQVTVGSWSGLELAIDSSQKFLSGGFLLRAITDVDVAVLRDESFTGYKAVI